MDVRRLVGKNVRRLRLERGWSQEELAFEADIHRSYISDIERGVRNPTITVVERLAETLEVSTWELLKN